MGKAKHFKQIRRIASGMPVLNTRVPIGEVLNGVELYKSGTKVDGQTANPNKMYRGIRHEVVVVNHYRQTKKYYYKNGPNGVKGYILAVQRFVSAQKVKEQQKKAG